MANTKQYKRNYIKGSARERAGRNSKGEYSLIAVDLLLEDLQNLPVNEAGYVKITLSRMDQPDRFGNTHSIFENDFKPDPKQAPAKKTRAPF